MRKVAFLFLFGLVFSMRAQEPQDTKLFLVPQELKADEDCYVFATLDRSGTKRYKGQVRGFSPNAAGPQLGLIVIEIFGEPFGETGIYSAMSGVPVCVKRKGKWYKIGNISRGSLFARKSLAYLTPIHDVLAAEYDTTTASKVSFGVGRSLFFSLTHFEILSSDKRYDSVFKNFFRNLSIEPVNFIGSFSNFGDTLQRVNVSAGKVLGIQLMWGDIDLTAYGTVSHIDGNKIWLLGHPLFGLGPVEYRIVDAEVLDYQSSYANSYLVVRPTGVPLGVITQDRNTGIFGKLGELPKNVIPVTVTMRESNRAKRIIDFKVVNNPFLTSQLLAYGVFSSVASHTRFYGDVTIFQKERIVIAAEEGKIDTVISSQAYVSSAGVPPKMFNELTEKYTAILSNPFSNVQIKSIEYEFEIFDERREKEIAKAYFVDDKPYFDRGDSTILKIILTQPHKPVLVIDFPFIIPSDAKDGKGKIIVGNSLAIQEEEGSQRNPGTLKSLLERMKSGRRKDAVYIYIQYPPYEVEQDKSGVTARGARKISKRVASNIEEYEVVLEGFYVSKSVKVDFKIGKDGNKENEN
jgi:hypothetical protein